MQADTDFIFEARSQREIRFQILNIVPLSDAITWAASWQEATKTAAWWENNLFNSFKIPNESIAPLLAQDASEIRTYLGLDNNGDRHLLLVGVDSNGKDMLNEAVGQKAYNFANPCPQFFGGNLLDT